MPLRMGGACSQSMPAPGAEPVARQPRGVSQDLHPLGGGMLAPKKQPAPARAAPGRASFSGERPRTQADFHRGLLALQSSLFASGGAASEQPPPSMRSTPEHDAQERVAALLQSTAARKGAAKAHAEPPRCHMSADDAVADAQGGDDALLQATAAMHRARLSCS
jgi:hypothetical protein